MNVWNIRFAKKDKTWFVNVDMQFGGKALNVKMGL